MTTFTAPVKSLEFEGFFYVESNGSFFKGCKRCGGTGHYSFDGYDSICYLCNNVYELRLGDAFADEAAAQKWCHERAVRKAQADRKREAARLATLAKRQTAWDALATEHPAVWALVSKAAGVDTWLVDGTTDQSTERDSFVLSLAQQLWSFDERTYTERQIAALQLAADRRVARTEAAAFTPAPEGRVVVTGEVASTKVVEGDYGTTYKMLVKSDEGYKVWCSVPSALLETTTLEEAKGRRITFTATLEPSRDDVAFAFGKRPTKGAWL